MLRLLKNKRAQNTIEYALIIAVVIGAFTAMQLYNRRAISMRVKKGMDIIPFAILGSEKDANGTSYLIPAGTDPETFLGKKDDTQYEPYYYAKGAYDMYTNSTEGIEETKIGVTPLKGTRTLTGQSTQRTGTQEVTGWKTSDEASGGSAPAQAPASGLPPR